MDHYEIEDVRSRAGSPDLRLVFGLNQMWGLQLNSAPKIQTEDSNLRIHIGIQNLGQTVAETALIEIGIADFNLKLPLSANSTFANAGEREVKISGVPSDWTWWRCRWTPQHLQTQYTPLFAVADPEYVARFDLHIPQASYSGSLTSGKTISLIPWRIQAPKMKIKTGIVSVKVGLGKVWIVEESKEVLVGPVVSSQ